MAYAPSGALPIRDNMKTHKDDVKSTTIGLNEKDELTVKQEQDVSALIEQNKKEYNNAETKWRPIVRKQGG